MPRGRVRIPRLLLAAAVAAGLAGCTREPADSGPPNIVLIYVDDLDFDEIGVYDHLRFPTFSGARALGIDRVRSGFVPASRVLTPNIDGLARDGAVFTHFYVTSPACTPSRYSALTGRYASRSAPLQREYPPGGPVKVMWNSFLGAAEPTVARHLKRLGYRTGHVGKWHLGGEDPMRVVRRKRAREFDPRDPDAVRMMEAAYQERVKFLRDTHGFDFVGGLYVGNLGSEGWDPSLNHHNMEWVAASALEFLEQGREDQPFFLYVAPTLLHGLYLETQLAGSRGATPIGFKDTPPVLPSRESILERVDESGFARPTGLSTWLDDAVGAILAKLDEQGIADRTLVMLVSDHQSRGKLTLYEGARVPAIARWPAAIEPGTRIDALSANIDLGPTFVDLAGGDSEALDFDGRSLAPLLRGAGEPVREELYLEIAFARGVVTRDWKYVALRYPRELTEELERRGELEQLDWDGVARRDGVRYAVDRDFPSYRDSDQLYDLREDVYEQTNLARDPRFAPQLEQMRSLLRRELRGLPHTFGEFKTE